jgi:hypothetical protein
VERVSSLGNIVKGCWVFPLFEKGFPRITSCVLCMVILLVILVYCNYCVAALFMVQVHAKLKRNYMCLRTEEGIVWVEASS